MVPSSPVLMNRIITRDDDDHEELARAQAHVWNHVFNFVNSMSLKCAVELGLPEIIHRHGSPMTVDQLISAMPFTLTPYKSTSIHRLLRLLTHSGFFIYDRENHTYNLTLSSKLLTKDHPFSSVSLVLMMTDPVIVNPSHHLSDWFRAHDDNGDNKTPFEIAMGLPFWEFALQDSRTNHLFNEAMANDARLITIVMVSKCREVFDGLSSLVDVGGGTGTLASGIAEAFPHVDCTVLDLPHVVAGLKGSNNLNFAAGDMFEAVPPADAVLLKWILHDWSDEECLKILGRCKEAISGNGKNGKLIVIDMIMDSKKDNEDVESTETRLFFDAIMMTLVTGKERSEEEMGKLFGAAGFTSYKIVANLGSLRHLIEVYP